MTLYETFFEIRFYDDVVQRVLRVAAKPSASQSLTNEKE